MCSRLYRGCVHIEFRQKQDNKKVVDFKLKRISLTGKMFDRSKQNARNIRTRVLSANARNRYQEKAMEMVNRSSKNKDLKFYKVFEPTSPKAISQ